MPRITGPAVPARRTARLGAIRSFFGYDPSFTGGVRVASGDITGDGVADIITGVGPGGGLHVKVFSGATSQEVQSFFAFSPTFQGDVNVAAGDLNGDGHADIVTGAGPGGLPQVRVYSGADGSLLSSFLAGDRTFTGGVYVAAIPAPGALALLAPAGLLAMRRRR